jgi:RNA polymerase sigma-70 factor (ECF subfamily)
MDTESDREVEAELIAALCRRHPRALAAIYDRYSPSVYTFFVRIARDQGTAEDLVQELFLRLWNRTHIFDPRKGGLRIWLFAVARNMAIEQLRFGSAHLAGRVLPLEPAEQLSYSSSFAEPRSIMTKTIGLKAALAGLRVHERRVVKLAYFERDSQNETAPLLQQPLGTVKSRMRCALIRLRLAVKGHVRMNRS